MPWPDREPLSLTARVLLFVALALGSSLVTSAALLLSAVEGHFREQDLDELTVALGAIADSMVEADGESGDFSLVLSGAISGHHGVYFRVEGSAGRLVYRSGGPDLSRVSRYFSAVDSARRQALDAVVLDVREADGLPVVGIAGTTTVETKRYRIFVAMDVTSHQAFLAVFRRSLALIMLGAGGLALLAAWFGIRQGHLPLRRLSQRVREIRAIRLHLRLDPRTLPIELRELATSFNHMIGGLERGFEQLSHFSSDIAHELRTPLTSLITQTQVTLSKPRSAAEYRELLYSSLEELERLSKMVSDMLWLAKSDNALIVAEQTALEPAQEVRALFEFFEALAADRGVNLRLEGTAPVFAGDRGLIRRALSNLLSNAIRHTPAGETVTVRLSSDLVAVGIAVSNPGESIPEIHLPKLFDRFYRVDPARQRDGDNVGLGLAIVKSIVEAHGGTVSARSFAGVTEFHLTVPRG